MRATMLFVHGEFAASVPQVDWLLDSFGLPSA
jgi:hypothetical protein